MSNLNFPYSDLEAHCLPRACRTPSTALCPRTSVLQKHTSAMSEIAHSKEVQTASADRSGSSPKENRAARSMQWSSNISSLEFFISLILHGPTRINIHLCIKCKCIQLLLLFWYESNTKRYNRNYLRLAWVTVHFGLVGPETVNAGF